MLENEQLKNEPNREVTTILKPGMILTQTLQLSSVEVQRDDPRYKLLRIDGLTGMGSFTKDKAFQLYVGQGFRNGFVKITDAGFFLQEIAMMYNLQVKTILCDPIIEAICCKKGVEYLDGVLNIDVGEELIFYWAWQMYALLTQIYGYYFVAQRDT